MTPDVTAPAVEASVAGVRLLRPASAGLDGVAYEAVDSRKERLELWRLSGVGVQDRSALDRRLSLLLRVIHPAVLSIRRVDLRRTPPHIVIEPAAEALADVDAWTADRVRELLREAAGALAEAHRLGIVHGRLSGLDISAAAEGFRVDLTGLRVRPQAWVKTAPELRGALKPTAAADLWALGHIATGLLASIDERDEELDALVAELVDIDPEARPTARDVLRRLPTPAGEYDTAVDPVAEIIDGVPAVLGSYRLVERIGTGGMGSVFKAQGPAAESTGQDGTIVALKVLSGPHASNKLALERFRREARILSQLDTPHIARFIAANEDQGVHYLVMEYVEGQSALGRVNEDGALPIATALSIATDVARALCDVHAHGLIHRDVKPSNVLVRASKDGGHPEVKLCDFGIARTADVEKGAELTHLGGTPGTPFYMAPEQIQGGKLDARVDVYALGASLYHLLAGEPPYSGLSHAVLTAHVNEPVPDIREKRPEVAEEISSVICRAMSKNPAHRHADATELLEELERALHGAPATVRSLPQLGGASGTPLVYEFEWDLDAPPDELWPHVSNTERLNRAIGLDDVKWRRTAREGEVRTEGEFLAAGVTLRWQEHPFEWVAPRRLGVLREYSAGPFHWLRNVVDLEPRASGTRLTHRIEVSPRGPLGQAAASAEIGTRARTGLDRVYRRIDAIAVAKRLAAAAGRRDHSDPFEPPTELLDEAEARIDAAVVRIVEAGGDAIVAEQLGEFLRNASPQAIGRIRPVPWARQRDLDPDSVLSTFLLGSTTGALSFLWDILCPACRIPSSIEGSLKVLNEHGNCEACDLDFELDLARSVELVFRAHSELREADVGVYCIGGPAHSPHVLAQVRLQPRERFCVDLGLSEGVYQVAGRRLPRPWQFRVRAGAQLEAWDLPLREGLASDVPRSLSPGGQRVTLTNDLDHEVLVRIERLSQRDDAITAADAACNPLFRKLFPGEVLSPTQLMGMSQVALLLVELADENRLLAEDEREAYRGLIELQQQVSDVSAAEGGALVKLHGAGVLAVFTDRIAAMRAGLSVLRHASQPLRVAMHAGPAMMTTINDRLDYFGRTVHVAGHLLAAAEPGEMLVSEHVAAGAQAANLLAANGRIPAVVEVAGTVGHRVSV